MEVSNNKFVILIPGYLYNAVELLIMLMVSASVLTMIITDCISKCTGHRGDWVASKL